MLLIFKIINYLFGIFRSMTFIIGQRWISNTESQLGLGIITELQGRQVNINFPAAEEERIYAIDNAPLSRIIYKVGDEICTNDQQKLTVTEVNEFEGILVYTGVDENYIEATITEISLNCFIQLNSPEERLFSGLLDKLESFKLRINTLNHRARLQQSMARGLLGSRTNHLPHQVYIAHEVAQRYAPRVLLADEVGLGKTIEAGMILHYQLHTGRAKRVLIVVPDTLIHQWLVEMIRRFNLHFSIFDQNRFDRMRHIDNDGDDTDFADDVPSTSDNLFETEQLVLCSLNFLMSNEAAREQALSAEWDLLIVDEAHHLQWSETEVSAQYQCVEQLAAQSKGLLLLTATPEQVGIESHFARLRLLDPSRFYDFNAFKHSEKNYEELNELVQQLVTYPNDTLIKELPKQLQAQLQDFTDVATPTTAVEHTIKNLLDRHGTGRVLFRNTRAAIQGFPKRIVESYPLPCPAIYAREIELSGATNLYPESLVSERWIDHDPRVRWLAEHISALAPAKVLVICAQAKTALALEQHLKLKVGIRTTAFHEGLSIIDRDRAAAYFAEEEDGAQALICSEIGSEGRNFQFAHHLVLFDLPLNPDLVEQRIGRLDRIGQRHDIHIHVPYIEETAQEKLFHWYHEGLNLFETSCSVGFTIYQRFKDELGVMLSSPADSCEQHLADLIDATQDYTQELNKVLSEGRDRLLEMNSCNLPIAKELIDHIEAEEDTLQLEEYMAKVFQEYGIDHESHSEHTEILFPSSHMKSSHFPGLKEDGMTITYSRPKALVREDIDFLSWEHPMVYESMDMILDSELGNAAIATISVKSIPPGTLFLEAFYTVNCAAPKQLQLDRFLTSTPIRLLMNVAGKNLSKVLDYTQLNSMCDSVKRHLGYPIIKQIRADIETILIHAKKAAELEMQQFVDLAQVTMEQSLGAELSRLEALQKINPSIREEELAFFRNQISESNHYLNNTTLNLQALRVVINK